MMMIIICFIAVLLFSKFNVTKYIDVLTLLVFIVQFSYNMLTENEATSQLWINSSKLLIVDLLVFSSILKWVQAQSNGTGKPYLIISVFFLAFFLSQFSMIGDYLASLIQTSYLPTFAFFAHVFLLLIHFRKIEKEL
jgi:hypothetical protein